MASIVVSELEHAHPGGEPLLFDVGFTISPGEHAAIGGSNGAGKSTLLRVLAGELAAVSDLGERRATTKIVTLEGSGCWVHGGSYASYGPARERHHRLRATHLGGSVQPGERPPRPDGAAAAGDRGRARGRGAAIDEGAGSLRPGVGRPPRVRVAVSGGQKARLEILCLEFEGHNFLLLDEPTDNLDIESTESLERALDGFEGTVVAVSHDGAFLHRMTRFLLIADDGAVFELPDHDLAIEELSQPDDIYELRLAKLLSVS